MPEDAMPFGPALIQELIEHHNIPVKRLALRSGYDTTTVYRWIAGERTAPIALYTALFELTRDLRLVALLAGSVPLRCSIAEDGSPPAVDAILPGLIAAIEQCAEAARAMHAACADRQITPSDGPHLRAFRHAASAARRSLDLALWAMQCHAQAAAVEV